MFLESKKYTFLGFLAIIIWGTSAIFTRNLSTSIGAYTSAALVNLIGGIVVLGRQMTKKEEFKNWKEVTWKYWPICGILFILYTASSYVSMSIVEKNEAVVTLVLIRFLWPLFTLIFTIPILKAKASKWLIASVSVSMIGIIVAKLGNTIFDLPNFVHNIVSGDDIVGYLMGFVVAISWGLYTNLTKKYVGSFDIDGVGIYMISAAMILGVIALNVNEPRQFSINLILQILYAGVVVGSAANVLWNLSIKKGNMLLVVLISNFLPIISTIMTSLLMGVGITIPIMVGSLLVVVGTMWSKKCFQDNIIGTKYEI